MIMDLFGKFMRSEWLADIADGILVSYIDAVLNHKFGADRTERFEAMPVRRDNRLQDIPPSRVIEVAPAVFT